MSDYAAMETSMANKTNVDYVDFVRQDTAPAKPAVRSRRQERVYLDGDGEMQRKSDDGTTTPVGGSGGTAPILTGSGAPTDGVTGAGVASPGWTYIDTTGAAQYLQIGTLAVPVWGFLGAHGVRVLNAPTDGVLVDDVLTGTSEWTVPLNSGPAASRDHATVIVTSGDLSEQVTSGMPDTRVEIDGGDFPLSSGAVGSLFSPGQSRVLMAQIARYRDTSTGPVYHAVLPSGSVEAGNLFYAGPLAGLWVKTSNPDTNEPAPLLAGGHIEFWLG